jgi:hypothetical protein
MLKFVRGFLLGKRLKSFARLMTWNRRRREQLAKQVASDALEIFRGGLAVYLNDTHGEPRTDSDMLDLLHEQRICILVILHAVQDSDARKFLTLGLIEQLFHPMTGGIPLRSGSFEIHRPPIQRTDAENS